MQELFVAVPLPALPEHLSSGDVQGGEQRRRVVVKFAVCSPLRGGVSRVESAA